MIEVDEPAFLRRPRAADLDLHERVRLPREPVSARRTGGLPALQPRRVRPRRRRRRRASSNEQASVGLDTPHGKVLVRQIAGLVARRIVTDHEVGTAVHQGERMGMIRFGSRVDLFLPAGDPRCWSQRRGHDPGGRDGGGRMELIPRGSGCAGPTMRQVVVVMPSAFTLGNLFFGFWAIVSAFNGNFRWAGWFIVFAGILDMLDGRVARLSNTGTRFGAELDSLVDVISFGVAPGAAHLLPRLRERGAVRLGAVLHLRHGGRAAPGAVQRALGRASRPPAGSPACPRPRRA